MTSFTDKTSDKPNRRKFMVLECMDIIPEDIKTQKRVSMLTFFTFGSAE